MQGRADLQNLWEKVMFVFLMLELAQDRYQNLDFHFNVEFPLVHHVHVRN